MGTAGLRTLCGARVKGTKQLVMLSNSGPIIEKNRMKKEEEQVQRACEAVVEGERERVASLVLGQIYMYICSVVGVACM